MTSALLIGRIITSPATLVSAQCFGGVETYEKTSGTTVVCAENECTSRGLLTQPDTSVTRDCIAICKQSSNCNSFTVGKRIFKSISNALSVFPFQIKYLSIATYHTFLKVGFSVIVNEIDFSKRK